MIMFVFIFSLSPKGEKGKEEEKKKIQTNNKKRTPQNNT